MSRNGVSPDRDRRALAAVAIQFWINGMVYAAVVPRLPDIRDRLSIDVSTLGLALTLSAVGGLVGSAIAGPVIVRFGTRRSIIAGTIGMVTVLPLVGLVNSTVALVLCLAALSMVDVVVDIGMNMQGSWLSARRPTPVMNRLHGLWSLGTVVGGLIAVQAAGAGISIWAHLLGAATVLAVTLAVSGRHLLPVDPPADPVVASPSTPPTARPGGRRLGYIVLGVLGGAAVTMEMTTSDWAAFRLADDLNVGPGSVGLGFVAFTAGMVTGRFAGDLVQAKLGSHRLTRAASLLAAVGLLIATVLPTGLYDGVPWLSPTVVSIAGFYIAALGVSVIFPQLYDTAAKASGPAGRGLAALTGGTRIAGLAAPVIVGVLADTSLSVGTAMALVTVPCCLITFALRSSDDPERPVLAAAETGAV